MCSASEPTASPAARARTPTSGRGNSPRLRGFTLIELMVVVALVAIVAGMVSLSLRDPAATRLEQEGGRLAVLLEAGRTEARASHIAARWELPTGDESGDFRFVGLPRSAGLPDKWLNEGVHAEIVGARAVVLGPEPMIGAQRIVLHLGERQVVVATDGLAPFAVVDGT